MRCLLAWARGSWTASGNIRYTGSTDATAGKNDGVPAYATLDLNAGYSLKRPLYKKFGRGARIALGIGNLFNAQPTWVDTLAGYRGVSPIGRTYSLTMTVPL
jgi:outer membrane receptor protein involved in Fe transport